MVTAKTGGDQTRTLSEASRAGRHKDIRTNILDWLIAVLAGKEDGFDRRKDDAFVLG